MVSKYESKARKLLREQGYLVDWKLRATRPIKGYTVDYFGLFDILAYRAGDPIRWISIKGHAGVPKAHRDAINSFFLPEGNQKELWVFRKDGTVKKELYHQTVLK